MARLKTYMAKTARSLPWAEMMLDWVPNHAVFWDGQSRIVPRRLSAEMQLWRRSGAGEARAVYEAYAGGDVLDIGSFHGLYALILAPKAKAGARFLCFEPDPRALGRLQHNLGIASSLFPGVTFSAFPWVAGDGSSVETRFPMGEGHPQFASAAEEGGTGARSLRADDCVSLLGLRPTFMKVDVEGAELAVLRGLEQTLSAFRPDLMLELHPHWQPAGSSVDAVMRLLQRHGYSSRELSIDDTSVRQLWRAQGRRGLS